LIRAIGKEVCDLLGFQESGLLFFDRKSKVKKIWNV